MSERGFWLVKSEPSAYSWDDLVKDGSTFWDGVRNPQARNNLQTMRKGDYVFFYHSVKGCEIVGVARVARESYPDPTTDDERWVVVDLEPLVPLRQPVTLAQVKADKNLRTMALVRQSRLSVMPLSRAQFQHVLSLAGTRLRGVTTRRSASGSSGGP